MNRRWLEEEARALPEDLRHYHPLIAQLLMQRGITSADEAERYINPRYDRDSHDPFLFDDMASAVDRIARALLSREHIAIYNDYDADGLCAGALLHETLAALGADIRAVMNHRENEGYGLHINTIKTLAEQNITLIITTDCGISNKTEIDHASALGIDVIITDHHTIPARTEDMPNAYAIIHPLVRAERYPYKHLSGGGSAFKLAQALIRSDHAILQECRSKAITNTGIAVNWEGFEKWLLDLVCISTIADCVPLSGENRSLVYFGLRVLSKSKRIGLRHLITQIRMREAEATARTISFSIAPRLNAASRMAHARHAFDLLISRNDDDARNLCGLLEQLNTERRRITETTYREAREQFDDMYFRDKRILVGSSDNWPLGILGLVAGKLCDHYRLPVVLVTTSAHSVSGAARSIEGFNIAHAFEKINHLFERYGGHSAAGGFALKQDADISTLRTKLEEIGEETQFSDISSIPVSHARIRIKDITIDFIRLLQQLAPFGQGNPYPHFTIINATIEELRTVGARNAHLRTRLEQDGKRIWCIGFSKGMCIEEFKVGDTIDILCELDSQEWQGLTSPEVRILDIIKHAV